MPVYPAGATGASSSCPRCACRDRRRHYPSDMTDAQWRVLEPEARAVMDQMRRAAGRPMVHDLRAMVDAIGYVVRNGIEWRALPVDFPPWEAVYAFHQRWSQRGLPQTLVDRLRGRLRTGLGREVQPSAAIVDSESVKAADTVGAATRQPALARQRRYRGPSQRRHPCRRCHRPRASAPRALGRAGHRARLDGRTQLPAAWAGQRSHVEQRLPRRGWPAPPEVESQILPAAINLFPPVAVVIGSRPE